MNAKKAQSAAYSLCLSVMEGGVTTVQQFLIHGWEQRASVTQILPSLKSASPYLHIFPATPAVRFVTSCPSQSGSHQPVLQLLACAAPNCNLPLIAICGLQFMETDGKLEFLRESPVLDMQMPIT